MGRIFLITLVYEDHGLLPHFLSHYRDLGVERIILGYGLQSDSQDCSTLDRVRLYHLAEQYGATVLPFSYDYFSTVDKLTVEKSLLSQSGISNDDFVIYVDLDEFHEYPAPLKDIVRAMGQQGILAVQGTFVDRIATDGKLSPIASDVPIADQFPVQCRFTREVLRGCDKKVMICRAGTEIDPGHHHAVGRTDPPLPGRYLVHHYKWVKGVIERIEQKLQTARIGQDYRAECNRFLKHFKTNDGMFRRTSPAFRSSLLDVSRKLALVMCVYKRLHLLPQMIANIQRQTFLPDKVLIINNNIQAKDQVETVVDGRGLVVHNQVNKGGWARFEQARQLNLEGFEQIVFVDDDVLINPDYIATFVDEFSPHSIAGAYAFRFTPPYQDYWSHRERATPGQSAHFAGTGSMTLPSWIFSDARVFECPLQFQRVEDLWLSAFCTGALGLEIIASRNRLTNFPNAADDANAQWRELIQIKSEMLRWLVASRGFPAKGDSHARVFTEVYAKRRWRNGSGGGSHPSVTEGYRQFLQNFLRTQEIKSVLDLGCGDWQFSRLMDWSRTDYTGVDVVASVIALNKRQYGKSNIRFHNFDIFEHDLPTAALCLIKDVFQHWDNNTISKFLPKLQAFKYVLITGTINEVTENIDIPLGSCRPVNLTLPPFDLRLEKVYEFSAGPGDIKAVLLKRNN